MKTLPSILRFVLTGSLAVVFHARENARAEDRVWMATDGAWGDKTKWNSVGFPPVQSVPSPGDNAQFFATANPYTVTVSGNTILDVTLIPTSSVLDLTFNLGGAFTVTDKLNAQVIGTLRFSGGSTANIGTLNADSLAIGAGTTVQAGTAVLAALNLTTGNFQASNLRLGDHGAITGGGTLTSTNATLGFTGFGPFLVNGSTWDNSAGKFSSVSGQLALSNGGRLKSASADLSISGRVTVDATTSWQNTGDAILRSGGELDVIHGGTVTIGGNLLLTHSATDGGGIVFLNYPDTGGASRLDVSGRVDAGLGSFFIAAGATLTSVGVVTRDSTSIEVRGTWTNTGNFVVGESGGGGVFGANDLEVRSGGTLTTSGDLIVGQQAGQNSFGVGSSGVATTATNVNGVLAQGAGSTAIASVGGTTSLWTNTGTLTVADGGTASLFIQNGGTATSLAATVGKQGGSQGRVTLSDNGRWTVNGNLVIGAATGSTGSVEVNLGSTLRVTGPTLTLGRDAGSDGTLTLAAYGRPTTLDFAGTLQVGLAGDGTLNVIAGFQLDQGAKSLVLGAQDTSSGTLHVSDAGSVFKSTNLTLGALGDGILKIENQGFVETTGQAVVGEMSGSTGTATILGTGARWLVDGSLVIGKSGSGASTATGKVTVKDGATLTVNGPLVTLGQETGSKGTLTLDGVGAIFSNPVKLEIGRHGEGTLEVKNGAGIILPSTVLGAQTDGHGTITVDGKGANNGPASSVTTSGSLTIGGVGGGGTSLVSGTLNITGGAQFVIDGGEAIVGRDAGAGGEVHLAGQGSQWLINAPGGSINGPTPGSLTIGKGGHASVEISDHAMLTTATLQLAREAGSDGTLDLIGSSGANDARLTVNGELQAGVAGLGIVTVRDGARLVLTDKLLVATDSGSTGSVEVRGVGSTVQPGNQLAVGRGGNGSVFVKDGASLTTRTGIIGGLALGGMGTGSLSVDGTGGASGAQFETLSIGNPVGSPNGSGVEVTGTGAHLNVTGALNVGTGFGSQPAGTGQFTLGPGGTVTAAEVEVSSRLGVSFMTIGGDAAKAATFTTPQLRIGGDSGGQATVTVDAGGRIDASAAGQTVRVNQNGQLTVEGSAASVAAHDLLIDRGVFTLINNASTEVESTFSLTGGGSGATSATVADSGRLTVLNSALVDAGAAFNVHDSGQVAIHDELRISHGGSVSVFHNGSITQTDIQVGSASSGTGTLNAADGGHLDAILLAIGGGSTVSVDGGGNIHLGSTQAAAALGTIGVAADGVLTNNGTVNGTVVVQTGGTVGGAGRINGLLVNAGTVAPGNSPGTLHVTGGFTQSAAGTLQMQIAGTGAGQYDVLDVGGTLTLGGTLELDFLNGFLPQTGDTFSLLTFGTLAGQFAQVTVNGLASGWQFTLAPSGNTFQLLSNSNATAGGNPPPPTDFLVPAGPNVVVSNASQIGATQKIIFQGGTFEATGNLTLGNQVNLPQDGKFFAGTGTDSTLGGVLSGTGALVKSGPGTLTLTAQNLYLGGTAINGGVLAISTDANLGAASGALSLDGGTLRTLAGLTSARTVTLKAGGGTFDTNGFDSTLDGPVTGPGALTKTGAGALTLTAANDYAGGTTLSAGTLAAAHSAALGTGSVTVNGGVLRTAGALKTIMVGGGYTQAAGGTLLLGIGGKNAGEYDRLSVAGHASLGGALRLESRNNFQPALGDTFAVLDAAGGVSGQFAQLVQPDFALRLDPQYTPAAVTLTAVQVPFVEVLQHLQQTASASGRAAARDFAAPAITPTQFAVAAALDSALGAARVAKLIAFLDTLPLGALPGAFEDIAPEELTSIFNLGVSLAGVQNTNLQRRMDDLRNGAHGFSAEGFALSGNQPAYSGALGLAGAVGAPGKTILAPAPDNRWGVFVTGLGEFADVGSTDNARGYDFSTGGVTLGIDCRLAPGLALGVSAGYARTHADLAADGRVNVDGGKLGLYATLFRPCGFYLDAAADAGLNSYSTQRRALRGRARGDTDGSEFNALLGTGWDWKKGALTLGPTATFQYTRVELDGFRERGSLAPLALARQSGESLRTTLGLKAGYELRFGRILVRPELRAAWQHEFGDRTYALDARFANGAGQAFTVDGPALGRESLLLGAGVAVEFSERTTAYLFYDGQIARTNYDSHSVSVGFRLAF